MSERRHPKAMCQGARLLRREGRLTSATTRKFLNADTAYLLSRRITPALPQLLTQRQERQFRWPGQPCVGRREGIVGTSGADEDESDTGTDGETHSIEHGLVEGSVGTSGRDGEREDRGNMNGEDGDHNESGEGNGDSIEVASAKDIDRW